MLRRRFLGQSSSWCLTIPLKIRIPLLLRRRRARFYAWNGQIRSSWRTAPLRCVEVQTCGYQRSSGETEKETLQSEVWTSQKTNDYSSKQSYNDDPKHGWGRRTGICYSCGE